MPRSATTKIVLIKTHAFSNPGGLCLLLEYGDARADVDTRVARVFPRCIIRLLLCPKK